MGILNVLCIQLKFNPRMTSGHALEQNRLDAFDTYTYLIIGFIALLATLAMFFLHLVKKDLRKQPGDLISMIAFAEFWLALHWFISAIRTDFITSDYEEDSFFCKFNSFIAVNAASLEITYNLCLITYVFFTVRSAIRKSYIPTKSFHLVCWGITIGFFFYNQNKMYKRNPYGTCSVIMTPKDLYIGAAVILISTIYAIVIYIYTYRKLPNRGAEMRQFRHNFINYYRIFMQVLIVGWIIIFLSFMAQILSNRNDTFERYLFGLGRLGNTMKVLTPVILFLIRMEDPKIQKSFYSYYGDVYKDMTNIIGLENLRQNCKSHVDDQKNGENANTSIMEINSPTSNSLKGDSEGSTGVTGDSLQELNLVEDEPENWLNLLPAKMKESFTRTFVAAVSVMYYQTLKKKTLIPEAKLNPNLKEIVKFDLEGQSLMNHCKTESAILDCTFTIYYPEVFYSILAKDLQVRDFKDSFNIHYNEDTIKKAGESGGGASGELFMFSKDNKFILKTITNAEHKVFKAMMGGYSVHLRSKPDSLIGRIYGLFSFNFKMGGEPVRLIVMENLFCINKEAVLRKYDLKGSKHSRQVIAKYTDINSDFKTNKILKDIDFENIEKEINLVKGDVSATRSTSFGEPSQSQFRELLLERATADVQFFRKQEIIDFSMILAVVDASLCDTGLKSFNLKENSHHWMESEDRKFIYILGIIDYFQMYTFSKKAERFFKKVQKCNSDLETSSQPPFRYGERFMQFLRKFFK